MSHTILISGVSGGLGRSFATAALAAGHTVVGTLRRPEQVTEFEALAPGRAHGIVLDVTDTAAIAPAIERVEREVGPITALVNNAGYGVEGAFEETPLETVRQQFEVNVFGVIELTRAVLPFLRSRRAGHVVFITSMGGLRAFPGLTAYNSTKYAVEGLADALRQEVSGFGIHVTSIEPGGFRTNWAGSSMTRVPRSIADYDTLMDPIREHRNRASGNQLGNPDSAGTALLKVLDAEVPPAHLMLGSDALRLVDEARAEFAAEAAAWRDVSVSTDFADGITLG
ncbi:SDR family NAD(P)-dependent oxidoreductase [Mycetocola tolaasinivorans]|uniref:SDR family NAD(P)-dependent oxidoreductase n=1 Tax=Mycetocola tolaasinivorans TaxID=76635 RepID=A0A3L7A9G4_9MICO|nr:oxidoreductase [Mycetocola tolaasinivorans]RLP76817.1 SDR family NAD(P)-dependent oxidoreductase [Mycetocola tolaasinivorans]